MSRKPIVAGTFYESDFSELDKQINQCFESKFGPAALPIKKREKNIFGIIAPHAGYQFSGPAASWAYKEIAESKFCDIYIILGLSHTNRENCISLEDWETPFGLIRNDINFGKALMKNLNIKQDEEAHKEEHSIEVQLPFLQFVNKDHLHQIKICPIIVSSNYKIIAQALAKTITESRKSACLIASSDFTHFGLNYGYFPFSDNVKENMYNLDKKAIDYIKKLDSKNFLNYIEKTGATICGKIPIAIIIESTKILGAKKARLLNYYTSGDIVNDYSSAVGYAALVVE